MTDMEGSPADPRPEDQEPAAPPEPAERGAPFEVQLLEALSALSSGNLAIRMDGVHSGLRGEIVHTLNTHLDQQRALHAELTRLLRETGIESRLGAQADVPGLSGSWRTLLEYANAASATLTGQIRSCGNVLRAYADGDLSARVTVPAQGEMLQLAQTINELADRLQELKAAVEQLMAKHRSLGL